MQLKILMLRLLFISKDSVTSTEVPKEVGIALKREKTVVPFLLDNSEYQGSLEYGLQNVNYIDTTVPSFEERIKDLAKAICFASNKLFSTDNTLDKQQIKSFVTASINNTVKHSASYKTAEEMQAEFAKANVGDSITFGSYEQDSEKWEHKEPIEWLVLAREKDKMLDISKYCLDVKNYFDSSVVWKNSPIRTWLNDTFINYAFSCEEIKLILNAKKSRLTDNDNIFLLYEKEAKKFFISDIQRVSCPTKYACSQEVKLCTGFVAVAAETEQEANLLLKSLGRFQNDSCRWILRFSSEPKILSFLTKHIYYKYISKAGYSEEMIEKSDEENLYKGLGIRPAMWIDLKKQK